MGVPATPTALFKRKNKDILFILHEYFLNMLLTQKERETEVMWKTVKEADRYTHFHFDYIHLLTFSNISVFKVVCIFWNMSYFVSKTISITHTLYRPKHKITLGYF